MSTRVKICGVRRAEDVDVCVEAGVDAIGFNFYPKSPRYLTPEQAGPLVSQLPASVLPVGLFVGEGLEAIRSAIALSGVRAIQLHGEEEPTIYRELPVERIQVFRVRPGRPLPSRLSPDAQWLLLDAWVEGFGGEGHAFDWDRAQEAKRYGVPLMVAGGITPENVSGLLERVRPDGIDIASGVERTPGFKDPERIHALMRTVRQWEKDSR